MLLTLQVMIATSTSGQSDRLQHYTAFSHQNHSADNCCMRGVSFNDRVTVYHADDYNRKSPRRHLGVWKFQIFNGWDAQEGRTASACQILAKSQTAAEIWRFFNILRWRPSAILDFQKLEISTSGPIRRINMRHRAKFREDRSNRSGDIADFRFFKMAAAAILDFGKFKFLTVGTLKRVELRLHAKFRQNRSNRG